MTAQLREPVRRLEPLLAPAPPPRVCTPRPDGFRINKATDAYELTPGGREHAAMAQRMVLRYALGYESRAQIANRYGYAARHAQSVINGTTYYWLTAPIRERLIALGIGNQRMSRSNDLRKVEIRAALEKLAAQAWDMLIWPEHYSWDQKSEVSTDLYLLSGAWREDEP